MGFQPTLPHPEKRPRTVKACSDARASRILERVALVLVRQFGLAWESDFVRKAGESYATQMGLLVVGMVTTVMVTRALGPEGRGLYAVAITIGSLGIQFGNFGLPASNTYYLSQNRTLLSQLLGNSLLISFVVGGLGAAGVWALFSLRPDCAPVHGALLALGLAWIPLGLAYLLMQRLLLALDDVRSYNKIEMANRLCALSLISLAVASDKITPETIVTANLLGLLVSCLLTYSKLQPFLGRAVWPSIELLRNHFGVGIRAYLITAFGLLHMRIDLLMVKYLLGPEQTGYYSIASTVADYLLVLPTTVALILFPRLSAVSDVRIKLQQAKKAGMGTAVALLPLLAVAALSSRLIVRILFGRRFLPAADAFIWLLPGVFTLGIEVTVVQFLNSLGYPRILIWIWSAAVVLNVTLNFWAIPRFGINGASAVSSISYTLGLLAVVAVIWRSSLVKQPTTEITAEVAAG